MDSIKFEHKSVLLDEAIEQLKIKPDGIYVDGTLGRGGHTKEILKRLKTGKVIGIDQDENAIRAAGQTLAEYRDNLFIERDNFANVADVLDRLQIRRIDGFLLDLGVSSHQFDEPERGFSYRFDAKLDMRMDTRQDFSAWNVVNEYSQEQMTKIFWDFADEKWAKRVAEFIVEAGKAKKIDSTLELVDIIKRAIPQSARKDGGHPAKRIFQAIRMEVNGELAKIEQAINSVVERMNPKARIVVITFHSIEDGLVKNLFRKLENPCVCPRDFPVCTCGKKPVLSVIKPIITPSKKELAENPRAKSAKLRTAELR